MSSVATPRSSKTHRCPTAVSSSESIHLDAVSLAPWTESRTVDHVVSRLSEGQGGWMVTVNLDILRQCGADPTIQAMVDRADLRVADGMPLLWAARLQGTPLPERVCGSNLIHSLPAAAAAAGRSIYLLGGDPGAAAAAAAVLQARHPALRIVGIECPPYGFDRDEAEIAGIADRVARSRPEIVFVALGFPKQERLIERIRHAAPNAWWIGVGISFSFASGRVRRAPQWVQRLGLEWVHRTLQEPRRLFRRYFIHDIPFGLGLLLRSSRRRRPHPTGSSAASK
jgi:N-acetylglucosaminyldiphosphoundecaprenol N-acetyl-beta-D-mannosaminyltransferase